MNNKTTKWLLAIAVLLLVGAASTSIIVATVLSRYNRNDSGAIPISPQVSESEEVLFPEEEPEESVIEEPSEEASADVPSGTGAVAGNLRAPDEAGFAVSDGEKIWKTKTEVEIFRASYENGEGIVTAESFDGKKIVAPGTENSYTFKLKNTGNTGIYYTLEIDAYITPGDEMIPIESRVSRHDGKWIAGGNESWVEIPVLDSAEDHYALSAGRYAYYTLDWRWPFEGDDENDTRLGNLAMEEDITVTIVITTTAVSAEDDPDLEEGLVPPNTGDESILSLWISLAVGAAVLLIIVAIFRICEEKRSKNGGTGN